MRFNRVIPTASQAFNYTCGSILLFTLTGVLWRYHVFDNADPSKCQSTLTKGRWLDPPNDLETPQPNFHKWQAPGCLMRRYTAKDIQTCLQGRQVVFIGDSTMRQLYWATARRLDAERAYQNQHISQKHSNQVLQSGNVSLNFLWSPYLNESLLQSQLHSLKAANKSAAMHSTTAIIVVGGGLWHAHYLQEVGFDQWKQAMNNISFLVDAKSTIKPQKNGVLNLLAPVQMPLWEALSEERRRTIKPSTIEAMNNHLLHLAHERKTPIAWAFFGMSYEHPSSYDMTGLHVSEDIADQMSDVILNLRCNSVLAQKRGYPIDMTCCLAYPTPNWAQSAMIVCSVGILLLTTLLMGSRLQGLQMSLPMSLLKAFAAMALALCYCYLADRSQFFNKAQKQFIGERFWNYCGLFFLVGVFTIRRSFALTKQGKESSSPIDQPFLSRDQTDEWKGWMQIVILIYHYTGASTVLSIYELIRLLVASYLFMTGFGHAVFYYKKPDYSLKRVASVLVRLNILSVLLPYVMKTDYLFYYFAPLTSFFYLVIYMTMILGKERNHDLRFLGAKLVLSAAVVNYIIRSQLLFGIVFGFLKKLCNIHWNVQEWRFRLQLDSYIVYVGMLSGILFVRMTSSLEKNNTDGFSLFLKEHFQRIRILAIVSSLLTLMAFHHLAKSASNKYVYNAYVPYVSFLPIVSFIVLRNSTRWLRNYHSAAFAFVGRISLETFTLQFHAWLAADTKGLLRTGLLDVWYGEEADLLLLSIIFLWLAKEVSQATQTITNYIVDPESVKGEPAKASQHRWEEKPWSIKADEGLQYATNTALSRRFLVVVARLKCQTRRDLRIRLILITSFLWLLNLMY